MKRLGSGGCGLVLVLASTSWAQVTQRVSVDSSGAQAGDAGSFQPSITPDGRYVAFSSFSEELVPGDSNGELDVFVRDRWTGTTELVSVTSSGAQANNQCSVASISADGRYVAFQSHANNLVPGDTNGIFDTFVRDRQTGTTESASVVSGPGLATNFDPSCSISADGRCVAFSTFATGILPGVSATRPNLFVRDRESGAIELVDVDMNGERPNGISVAPSVSSDGRYVAFQSFVTNLVADDTNGKVDVFVRDRQRQVTQRASVDSSGMQGNGVSILAAISADGRWVAFLSYATNLVQGDTNGTPDVFVHDLLTRTTERVSLDWTGTQGNNQSFYNSISGDGRYVAFDSYANNLVPGDTNGATDVYVRDRAHEGYPSLCEPGIAGVIGCPCSNPPSGPDRGCDNSSATGGASLSISGGAYLSSDSLVFTTRNETPTALSIVLQGTSSIPAGAIFGQGVRCLGGSLKRMYTEAASGGSVRVPDFVAGDPTVHVRSAALGDPIQLGQSRWYLVHYRDPIVLGGCPGSSTFNATQTGAVTWSP